MSSEADRPSAGTASREPGIAPTAAGIGLGVAGGMLVAGGLLLALFYVIVVAFDDGGAPAVSRVIVPAREFQRLKPGTSAGDVERRVGAGSENGQDIPEPRGLRCTYYEARGGGADAYQLCFEGDRLREKRRVDVAGGAGGGGFD